MGNIDLEELLISNIDTWSLSSSCSISWRKQPSDVHCQDRQGARCTWARCLLVSVCRVRWFSSIINISSASSSSSSSSSSRTTDFNPLLQFYLIQSTLDASYRNNLDGLHVLTYQSPYSVADWDVKYASWTEMSPAEGLEGMCEAQKRACDSLLEHKVSFFG